MRIAITVSETGELDAICADAPCEIYIVAPHVPHDRVYLYGAALIGPEHVREAIGGYAIGHAYDGTLDMGDDAPVSPRLPPIRPRLGVVE